MRSGSVPSLDVPTAPTAARSRIVGVVLGVAGLLALVVLAVVLPRISGGSATGSEESSSGVTGEPTEVVLPPTVPGYALVEAEDDTPGAADLTARLDSAEELVEQTYDVPVTVGLYNGDEGAQDMRTAVVTAATAPAGLFLPSGPAPDPELLGLERNQAELVRVGEAVCNVVYGEPVPAGQPVDESVPPGGVQCQLTSGDVTFQVDGSAMTAEEATALLEALAADQ